MKGFLKIVATDAVPRAEETMESMEVRVLRRQSVLSLSQFLKRESLTLHKLGAEQAWQVLRASLTVDTYSLKDGRIGNLFFCIFPKRSFPFILLIDVRFVHLVLYNSQAKAHIQYELNVLTAF